MGKNSALAYIANWCQENADPTEHEKFREVAEIKLLGLHEGNFARYRIKPSEFET